MGTARRPGDPLRDGGGGLGPERKGDGGGGGGGLGKSSRVARASSPSLPRGARGARRRSPRGGRWLQQPRAPRRGTGPARGAHPTRVGREVLRRALADVADTAVTLVLRRGCAGPGRPSLAPQLPPATQDSATNILATKGRTSRRARLAPRACLSGSRVGVPPDLTPHGAALASLALPRGPLLQPANQTPLRDQRHSLVAVHECHRSPRSSVSDLDGVRRVLAL